MSTGVRWHYNKKRLSEALAAWKATEPSQAMKDAVDAALMDLIQDPLRWGSEDPNVANIFHRSIRMPDGGTIGVLYAIPDRMTGEVGVADIRAGS